MIPTLPVLQLRSVAAAASGSTLQELSDVTARAFRPTSMFSFFGVATRIVCAGPYQTSPLCASPHSCVHCVSLSESGIGAWSPALRVDPRQARNRRALLQPCLTGAFTTTPRLPRPAFFSFPSLRAWFAPSPSTTQPFCVLLRFTNVTLRYHARRPCSSPHHNNFAASPPLATARRWHSARFSPALCSVEIRLNSVPTNR